MRLRCGKTSHCAKNYADREITICAEWLNNFDQFVADMGLRPRGATLERKNNDKGYSKDNCVWATQKQQNNNQRRNRVIEFKGKKQTLSQWADELNIEFSTLWRRLNRNLPLEKALTTGKLRAWKHGTRTGYELHKCRCPDCKAANTKRHQNLRTLNNERL